MTSVASAGKTSVVSADVLPADATDVLPADTTDVFSADITGLSMFVFCNHKTQILVLQRYPCFRVVSDGLVMGGLGMCLGGV